MLSFSPGTFMYQSFASAEWSDHQPQVFIIQLTNTRQIKTTTDQRVVIFLYVQGHAEQVAALSLKGAAL